MINKNAPHPLYHQVKDHLEAKIVSGEWPKGFQIPTEKELAERFDVSTITIKRAVLELVHQGVLYRQRGKGTFVTSKKETDLQSLVTLKYGQKEGVKHPHHTREFHKQEANLLIAKLLEVDEEDKVYKLSRIKMNDSMPIGLEYTYLPVKLLPDLKEEMIQDELLYSVLQNQYSIELGKAKIYFSTLTANETEAELLQIPVGEQLFVIERFTRTVQGEVIEYSKFIVRQEHYQFYIEVNI
ncbi:GntR family transcriptional regulator [Ornithinibacillus salinisoli]|uniref:GntR family transcriptional regulator n=1 Tax=Ornithinibacillus salinisoli TaxID=1848459 RepID=A0ABW4VZU1_9BACI